VNCNAWFAHLEEGKIILKTADMLVGFLDKDLIKIYKKQEKIFIINQPMVSEGYSIVKNIAGSARN
tara:strand:- start:752 stop:949 length:198 start_codon:yes stop_codon:yes gene_type:complete